MSTEANKAIIRTFCEAVWSKGDATAADQLCAVDVVIHGVPGLPPGLAGMKLLAGMYRGAFPNGQMAIDDLIAEGDRVVTRWTYSGTHLGDLMGMPPTQKVVSFTGILIDRITNGKIAEHWVEFDALGLMQQVGAPRQT